MSGCFNKIGQSQECDVWIDYRTSGWTSVHQLFLSRIVGTENTVK
jgi:hypothetical protein